MIDLFRDGLRGVLAHRLRSLLSTLGILFGVAAVIGILSIGEGARQQQEALIAQLGVLNFQITNREDPEDEEKLEALRRTSRGLSQRDVAALRATLPDATFVGGAREIVPRALIPIDTSESLRVLGAEPHYLAGTALRRTSGRPLGPADEQSRAAVAMLGSTAARQLFGTASPLGQRIRIDDVWFTVVGTMSDALDGEDSGELEGVDIDDRSRDIVIPLATALARFRIDRERPELDTIQVALSHVEAVPGNTMVARRMLSRLHREQEDFDLVVPLRLLEQSRAQQQIFNLVMGLIAGISLLVGGIGIMNIMLASVLERTREIGVRLAVGATPMQIRLLFLTESAVISLTGGILGVLAGFIISWLVAATTGWATAVSVWAVLLATVLSVTEGLFFGFLPANRAAKLPPAIAVRGAG